MKKIDDIVTILCLIKERLLGFTRKNTAKNIETLDIVFLKSVNEAFCNVKGY